jgi:hypothetical protein
VTAGKLALAGASIALGTNVRPMKKLLLAVSILALAGCGGAAKAASPTTSTSAPSSSSTATAAPPVNYGAKYLAIIDPLNTALKSDPTTQAQLNEVAADIGKAEGQLSSIHWPASAEQDVRTLVHDLGQLQGDALSDNMSAVVSDGEAANTAAAAVRSDLGLPTNLG